MENLPPPLVVDNYKYYLRPYEKVVGNRFRQATYLRMWSHPSVFDSFVLSTDFDEAVDNEIFSYSEEALNCSNSAINII